MLDQRAKIAAAAGVLLVGVVTALLFRRDPPPPSQPPPGTTDNLVLRRHIDSQLDAAAGAPQLPGQCDPRQSAPAGSQPAGRPITILTPLDSNQAPPELAQSYPEANLSGTSRWGITMKQMLPETARPAARQTHKVVDGDTLASLAERYLGTKDGAAAIFEANRDVLSNPAILPIGAELKLPPPGSVPRPAVPEKPALEPVR
jgi:nucleoid-associated protein YgaU